MSDRRVTIIAPGIGRGGLMDLRDQLKGGDIIVAPGAYDALSARVVEWAGFSAVYVTGFGSEAAVLGKPDLGYLTMSEAAEHAGNIAEAVNIPVICDADVGYGGALSAARAVRAFEARGVAGIHIEDQAFPKHCGLVGGTTVIPRKEFVGKIRAAVDARRSSKFLVIARIDAYESMGFTETIERANACADAGAEMVFIVAASTRMTRDEVQQLPKLIKVPLFGTVGGSKPKGQGAALRTIDDARTVGLRIVAAPLHATFSVTKTLMDLMTRLHATGDFAHDDAKMVSFDEFDRFIGLRETMRTAATRYDA